MLQSQVNLLIDSLGCWYDDGSQILDLKPEVEFASKVGYITNLHNLSMHNYLESKEMNPNSTFYKCWEDIVSKNRLELFIDQLLHYISTYGTNYEGKSYIPNENPLKIPYTEFKVIPEVTCETIIEKVMSLLGGISLKEDLADAIKQFVYEQVLKGYEIDIESIENKEVLYGLYVKLGRFPEGTDGIRRCLNYLILHNAMILQSKRNLRLMSTADIDNDTKNSIIELLKSLNENQTIELASEFLRFKNWWLAIKHCCKDPYASSYINKLRKLAKTHHKPFIGGFWENLTRHSMEYVREHLEDEISKLNNPYKVIRILEMIRLKKLQSISHSARIFKIRNGYSYMSNKTATYDSKFDTISSRLLEKLVSLISIDREAKFHNNKFNKLRPVIKFPENLTLMLPSSGKTFVGNIPLGSYYDLSKEDAVIGIYWRNEWGTHDFDLSLIDLNGVKIGWNSQYYNENVIFSGDMTNADPEAAEVMYIKKNCPDSTIQVNRFNGVSGSKYKLFFGKQKIGQIYKNFMVAPDSIQLDIDLVSDRTQQILGCISNNRCYFMNFSDGDSRVSYDIKGKVQSWTDMCKAHIPLKEILLLSGYRGWQEGDEVDIDLEKGLTKDALMSLL